MHEHATKPGTLGAGLSDSPAGLAAWIGEKIVAWSSTRPDEADGHQLVPESRHLSSGHSRGWGIGPAEICVKILTCHGLISTPQLATR